MSEIVVIKSGNQVGVIRREFTDNATGEQWIEVQPVGRAHGFNRFVRREDVETAGQAALAFSVSEVLLRAIQEIQDSVYDEINSDFVLMGIAKITDSVIEMRKEMRNANPPTT